MYLYAFLFAQFPELFFCVWNYDGDVLFVVGWWIVVAVVVVVTGLVGVGKFILPLVEGPVRKLTLL